MQPPFRQKWMTSPPDSINSARGLSVTNHASQMDGPRKKVISILLPAYNEESNLPPAYLRLTGILQALPEHLDYEVIVLDNASTDGTAKIAREFCALDSRWKWLRYSRNFGLEASMLAGIDHAAGDAVIILFSDLQDPPELIPEFIRHWEEGHEVVVGILEKRNDQKPLKTLGAKIAYYLIYALSDCKIPVNATDFRLLDRRVIDALRLLREPDRYLRGLIHWVGFKRFYIPYDRAERRGGNSTAGVLYSVRFALNAIFCFSGKPLHLATLCGGFLVLATLIFALVSVAAHLFHLSFIPGAPPGVTTLVLLISFFFGFNTMFLGIIGEYLGRIYNQGKQRPLYLVDEKMNFSSENLVGSNRKRS
jgi:polyisoprenyl-phosphate glycosyltransferase